MTDRFLVTEKMMENASTYIPLAEKESLATVIAELCVVPCVFPQDADKQENGFDVPAPPLYRENTLEKALCMTGCFLNYYLHENTDKPLNLPLEEYDGWAGYHLMNQIERFKGGAYKSKAFDMLSDFRDLEKRVNCAIYARLNQKNDLCRRLLATMMVLSSEDAVENAQAMLSQSARGILEEQRKQEDMIREAGDAEQHTDA